MTDQIDAEVHRQPESESPPNGRVTEYEVGYKKPPIKHRFVKGRSGNQAGRPRGSRSFKSELREVIEQPISVTENGRKKSMTARKAMLIRLRQKALQGDHAAIDRLLRMAAEHIPDEVVRDDGATAAEDRALLEQFEADLLRRHAVRGDDDGR